MEEKQAYGDNLCSKRYGASDDCIGRGISLAFATFRLVLTSWRRLLTKHCNGANKCVLCVPGPGIAVKFPKEDVHAVGLAQNVLRCFDVDDIFGVRAWLRRCWR